VAFAPADGVEIVLVPPRRVQGASALAEWIDMPQHREVVLEMATSWLAHAALPGLPEGVPGTSAEWQRWAQESVESCAAQWAVAQRGALLIKRPASQLPGQVAAWPVLRWLLVSAYLSQKIRGN